ncbi:HNH endonuclease signature motif containing protein [Tomitella cavernea]|uniref:HNH endonuclease signature motif containing protein n=1 Tax=Tomitella cavernea TaxID=1387982 RepID=A0ABP9C6X8_9ACTN|nr:HNH endonuclease signature motif containing protein [Tomitella cavernea]
MSGDSTTQFEGERNIADDDSDIKEVERELCTLAAHIAAATARFLILLSQFDRRGGWNCIGVLSCAHWLSWRCGINLRTARDQVRVARRLEALPLTRAAFVGGTLSYSKVRAITRVATPETEADLVESARGATASQLERLVRGLRSVPVPQPDKDVRPPEHRLSHRWDSETGDLVVSGRLSAADGKVLLAALTRAEFERRRTCGDEPDLTGPPPADAAPAVVAMAETMLAVADAPADAPASEVSFVVDHTGAHVEDGPALGDAAAATVICSASGRRIDAEGGRILRFGRRRRLPSSAQLRALHLRDGGCRHPACGRTRFLHAHHVRPWSHGGATDLDNLILLCGTCHRSLHEGAFGIDALGGQRFVFRAGAIVDAAPAMTGDPDAIRNPSVDAGSLTPDWDGKPLDLHYAVSVLAEAWERDRRRAA